MMRTAREGRIEGDLTGFGFTVYWRGVPSERWCQITKRQGTTCSIELEITGSGSMTRMTGHGSLKWLQEQVSTVREEFEQNREERL